MSRPDPRTGSARAGREAPRLVWRLFLAMSLVVVSGAATMVVVAVTVGPAVFHHHLGMIGAPLPSDTALHVDEAFGQAVLYSLGAGILVALIASVAVTWLVSRRVADPIGAVAAAAARVAAGDLTARAPTPAAGRELTALTDSFNTMATRLADTESTRRQLIADVAHELRNPLASLQATAEAAADGALPDDPATWQTVLAQTTRLQRLVDDMAAVSRAEERQLDLHVRAIPARALAEAAVSSVQARYDAADIDLRLLNDPGNPRVAVDAERMAEVLANLLGNALRHSHPGGVVTVRLATRESRLSIEVIDTGDGFPPEESGRLFERFYRGDTARSRDAAGSGIGLTLARSVITAHGGTLSGRSDGPGHGATFTITLPLTR